MRLSIMAACFILVTSAYGQDGPLRAAQLDAQLDSLLAIARRDNPAVLAARSRVDAAQFGVAPAGSRPDPMLMFGIMNKPLGSSMDGPEPMTMRVIGIEQMLPYPGKLSLRRQAARQEVLAAQSMLEQERLNVVMQVKQRYYELAYIDKALEIVARNQRVVTGVIRIAEAQYGVGKSGQEDVLRARIEAARMAEEAAMLTEQRRGVLAQLNALLNRPSNTPVNNTSNPAAITKAAIPDSIQSIAFVSAALGARVANSPLPQVSVLQAKAEQHNLMLRAEWAMLEAQRREVQLARKEHLPDVTASVSYGQRAGLPDMVSAMFSIPIPLQRRSKQQQIALSETAKLAAREAEYQTKKNEVSSDIARLHAELERARTQLSLYAKAILPQGQSALTASLANYQTGQSSFVALLETQTTLFGYETSYANTLMDFAKTLAELERVVGTEILQ